MFIRRLLLLALCLLIEIPAISEVSAQGQAASKSNESEARDGSATNMSLTPRAEQQRSKPRMYLPNCTRPKDHDEADLCEQMRMAEAAKDATQAAWIQLGVSVVGLIAIVATLIVNAMATQAASSAAEHAGRAVEVQIRIERAFLIVGAITIRKSDPDEVEFDLQNIGKTVGVLTEWSAACRGVQEISATPIYGEARETRRVIWPQDSDTFFASIGDPQEVETVISGDVPIFVWGYFKYEDVLGRTRASGFCYCGQLPSIPGRRGTINLDWTRAGGEAYNYDREEKPQT